VGTYRGTISDDTITPDALSLGVAADPAGTRPSDAADVISGAGGADTIAGGGGADSISFSGVGSVVQGGFGNDDITYAIPTSGLVGASAYGDAGNDNISFEKPLNGEDYSGLSGEIRLRGGTGSDTLSGTMWPGNNSERIAGVDVYMYGEDGNDTLDASKQATYSNLYDWEPGNNDDLLYGGPGDDTYIVYEQKDVVIELSGQGHDTIESYGVDYALGPDVERLALSPNIPDGISFAGNDLSNEIIGGFLSDALRGLGGADTLDGREGADVLYGDLGNDTIYGQDGDDTIYGGRGLDDPTDGPDRIYGDAGNDQVWAGGGDDTVYGGTGNEIHLSGQSGNDTLYGDAGTDYLAGGSGNDILYGGTENDRLSGTDGLDRLFGQGGTDTFDYDAVSHSPVGTTLRDVVGDFTGVGGSTRTEVIDLSTIDANTGVSGNQAFTFRGTSAFSAPGQIRVQASGNSDTLIQANVTGTSGAEMEILVTDGSALPTSWNALDFLL